MEFGEFIRTLLKGIRGGNQEVFVTALFKAAGADTFGIDTKIKNWMSGRNEGYRDYFVGITFKDNEFVEFLKERTNETWPNIRREFKGKSGIVDCLAKDATVFFESVMIQFKDIVNYPYKKSIVFDDANEVDDEFQNETPSEQMLKTFKLAIFECEIIAFLNYCPSASPKVIAFGNTIKKGIEKQFCENRDEEMYQNIIEFACLMEYYNKALNTRDHAVVSFYSVIDMEIDHYYQRIVKLYNEICGGNTFFPDKPPIYIT